MFSRHRRVPLRQPTKGAFGPLRGGRHQAHRRQASALPRAAMLLTIVAAAALVFRPNEAARATPVWTWSPLPANLFTAVGPAPSEVGAGRNRLESSGFVETRLPSDERSLTANGTGGAVNTESRQERSPTGPTHIVAQGDTLWTIARRHSADLASILRWNAEVDPQHLVAGQRILVPGGSTMAPLPRPAAAQTPAAPQTVTRVAAGGHLWPLPVRGLLTTRFSSRHLGIDIAAPKGTPVRAIAAGTVVWAGWKDNGGGYVVEIKHSDGMLSTYNHNGTITVQVGDKVAQGTTIALVGSTGWSTGPHLDLRIQMSGRFVDPLAYF